MSNNEYMASMHLSIEDYASAGIHPRHPQNVVKNKGTVDGVYSPDSPWKMERSQAIITGFTPVFSLKTGIDDAHSTFSLTGFNDVEVIRTSLDGLPVDGSIHPSNKVQAYHWVYDNIAIRGVTAPDTDLRTQDIDRKYAHTISGSTDCIVSDNFTVGDIAIARPATEEEMIARLSGTMLERRNPRMLSVIKFDTEFFVGAFSDVLNFILADTSLLVNIMKAPITDQVKAIIDKMKSDRSSAGPVSPSQERQVKHVVMYMRALRRYSNAEQDFMTAKSSDEQETTAAELRKRAAHVGRFVSAFYMDQHSKTFGKADYGGKKGFLAHLRLQ